MNMNLKTLGLSIAVLTAALSTAPASAAQQAGDRTFTLSGNGASDKDFDSNSLGLNAQLGWLTSDSLELGVRQSVNILAIANSSDTWSGSTLGYADWHFGQGRVVPYVGANIGAVYGEEVKDTAAAGLEAGLRYYVKEKTFIAAQIQYEFLFDDANDIDNRFNNGAFFYALGIGFNF